jgi:hypothetical protein
MTLSEYAAALEKSRKPGDAAVARYIRTHEARLAGWLKDFTNGMSRADREELTQVCLLAVVEAVRAPDAETALRNVRNAMERASYNRAAWNARRSAALETEND